MASIPFAEYRNDALTNEFYGAKNLNEFSKFINTIAIHLVLDMAECFFQAIEKEDVTTAAALNILLNGDNWSSYCQIIQLFNSNILHIRHPSM